MKINGLNSTNNDDPYKQVNNKEEEVLSIAIKWLTDDLHKPEFEFVAILLCFFNASYVISTW